jgi:twinfilin-like protein
VLDTTTTPSRAAALPSIISPNEPRYTFYRYEEVPGQNETPIVFIYTCPNASKIKERMLYSTTRGFVVSFAEKECGVEIAKKVFLSDPNPLRFESLTLV